MGWWCKCCGKRCNIMVLGRNKIYEGKLRGKLFFVIGVMNGVEEVWIDR